MRVPRAAAAVIALAVAACGGAQRAPAAAPSPCASRGAGVPFDHARMVAQAALVLPFGVLAPSLDVLYLHRDDDEVDALDVATGRVRWRGMQHGELLFATAREVALWTRDRDARRLVTLSAVDGTPAVVSPPLPLPAWVVASSAREPAEFVDAWPEGGFAVVRWSASASWHRGAPPSAFEAAASRHQDCGSLRIELTHGAWTEGGEIQNAHIARAEPSPQQHAGETWLGDQTWLRREGGRLWLVDAVGARVPLTDGPSATPADDSVDSVTLHGDVVYVVDEQHTEPSRIARALHAYDRTTGVRRWSYEFAPRDAVVEPP